MHHSRRVLGWIAEFEAAGEDEVLYRGSGMHPEAKFHAAVLERLRKSRDASLKDLVNEALRRGLKDMGSRTKRRERLRTRSVALGQLRIAGLDNALAIAEGEAYK